VLRHFWEFLYVFHGRIRPALAKGRNDAMYGFAAVVIMHDGILPGRRRGHAGGKNREAVSLFLPARMQPRPTYKKLDEALAALQPGETVWAREYNEHKARLYYIDTPEALVQSYLNSPEPRIADEVLLNGRPCRLFFDLDAKGMTEATMIQLRDEIIACTLATIKELGETEPVTFVELDGSTPEKQSKHIIFSHVITSISGVRKLVTLIRERVSPEAAQIIDLAPYAHKKCLRLALSKKFKPTSVPLLPVGIVLDTAEKFMKTLILAPGAPRAFDVEDVDDGGGWEEGGEGAHIDRIKDWLAPYGIRDCKVKEGAFRCLVRRYPCAKADRVHANNHIAFTCRFDDLHGSFMCLDPECNKATWMVSEDLEYICFPDRMKAQMDALLRDLKMYEALVVDEDFEVKPAKKTKGF
jgi:hypothetical protein